MRKPIFIIEVPGSIPQDEVQKLIFRTKALQEDYHVFVVVQDSDLFSYKMFSDKEIEPIELEKLKEILKLK